MTTTKLLDVIYALRNLADALEAGIVSTDVPMAVVEAAKPEVPVEEAKPEVPAGEPAGRLRLEDVRAILADISRQGKTKEMKGLLGRFGASKLSDVDPARYAELVAEAEVVRNA